MSLLLLTQRQRPVYSQRVTGVHDEEPAPYVVPLNVEGTEVLSFDTSQQGGWAAYFSEDVGLPERLWVLLRIGPIAKPPASAPLEVREMHFAVAPDSTGFSSGVFRNIPVLRIEAAINHPLHREQLLPLCYPPNMVEAIWPGGVRYRLPPDGPVKPRRLRLKISDPGGYRKPDEFYRQVADRYLWLAAISSRPAQELAEANDMPVATVHRWIREAKVRGLLLIPPHRGEPPQEYWRRSQGG